MSQPVNKIASTLGRGENEDRSSRGGAGDITAPFNLPTFHSTVGDRLIQYVMNSEAV